MCRRSRRVAKLKPRLLFHFLSKCHHWRRGRRHFYDCLAGVLQRAKSSFSSSSPGCPACRNGTAIGVRAVVLLRLPAAVDVTNVGEPPHKVVQVCTVVPSCRCVTTAFTLVFQNYGWLSDCYNQVSSLERYRETSPNSISFSNDI